MTSYSLQLFSALPSLPGPVLWVGLLVVPLELVAVLAQRAVQLARVEQLQLPPLL
jgi:hypothetical protein